MDVQDGLLFVSKAKRAFVDRDLVTAAKLTRHLKERSESMAPELDKERISRGVANKIDDAKCGKCGKEALYSFPGDVRKCIKCGHTFSMVVEPRATTMAPIEKPVSSSNESKPDAGQPDAEVHRKRKLLSR